MPTPVNAENVVTLDLLNLNGSVQFRVTLEGMFQWKLTASNTWYDITSLDGLRGRSVSAVTVNTQNKLVVSFDDNTSTTLTLTQLEEAVTRATTAATQALASAASAAAVAQGTSTARPSSRQSFGLDFANSRFLDRKIPFTRNSIGTYFDKNGFMRLAAINKPRFSHDPLTMQCLGLLLEESRTNLLLQSSDFTQPAWTKIRTSVTSSTTRGVYSALANKFVATGENDPLITQDVTISIASKTFTFSVFLWTDETTPTKATLRINGKTSLEELAEKVVTVNNISTRFEITKTFSAGAISTQLTCRIDPFEGETDAPAAGRIMYLDEAQLEQGLNATSYIPTTTAAVQRGSDALNITGTLFTELFPSTLQGTIFISAIKGKPNGNFHHYFLFQGANTAGGRNEIRLNNHPTDDVITVETYNDGVLHNTALFNVSAGTSFVFAIAFQKNDIKCYMNGVASADDFVVTIPNNLSSFQIGNGFNSTISQIMYWPRRVANAALQALTSTGLSGKNPMQVPAIGDLFAGAFLSPYAILREGGKETQTIDGTGASFTRNIKRPYDFTFELIDSSDATAIPSQPPTACIAGTSYPLIFTAPIGKSITYAITPLYEY